MHVQVRLGTGLATAAGTSRLQVELPPDATVEALMERLRELEPAIAPGLDAALPLVRGTHADQSEQLAEGDEVALLMPVAGGCAGPKRPQRREPWP